MATPDPFHGYANAIRDEPPEAINGVIEEIPRVAGGFRNFEHYRLRALLAAGGHRP
ncbi:transposase [uncultured Kocuria sp.]|uniref:transposase n=1 Tax=uncultured Kocuria sp. TaxID=259305 RepID=UPI00260DBB83|nr:transposase [uncultured Kocuria sp.]